MVNLEPWFTIDHFHHSWHFAVELSYLKLIDSSLIIYHMSFTLITTNQNQFDNECHLDFKHTLNCSYQYLLAVQCQNMRINQNVQCHFVQWLCLIAGIDLHTGLLTITQQCYITATVLTTRPLSLKCIKLGTSKELSVTDLYHSQWSLIWIMS